MVRGRDRCRTLLPDRRNAEEAIVRRLSSHDASFLALDGPSGAGHICLVAELDGRLDLAELRSVVSAHLSLTPILRQRLLDATFALARPWWVDDPEFDLEHHLF